MLIFHGVKYEFNRPIRFNTRYYLKDSLKLAVETYRLVNGDVQQGMLHLDRETVNKKNDAIKIEDSRRLLAISARAKDILLFFDLFPFEQTLIPLFEKLATEKNPENSWQTVKNYVSTLYAKQSDLSPEQFILKSDPGYLRIIEAIRLFYLDMIDEQPPANFILKLIPGDFPNHTWVSSDTVTERVLTEWIPLHPLTHKDKLLGDLIGHLYRELDFKRQAGPVVRKNTVPEHKKYQNKFDGMLPSQVFISIEQEEDGTLELPLMDSMDETFLRFQGSIAKKYNKKKKQNGLRFLSAIIFSIYENPYEHLCLINPEKTVKKLCGEEILKEPNDYKDFKEILNAFLNIQVTRIYTKETKETARRNFLLTELSKIGGVKKELQEIEDDCETEFYKDVLLIKTVDNLKPPGYGLRFLPEDFFKMKKIPHYYFEIGAFLTNAWFDDFSTNNGKTKITPEDLMNKAGILFPKSGHYKIINNIKSTLEYLKDEKFISYLNFNADSTVNTKKQLYEISAGEKSYDLISLDYNERHIAEPLYIN